MSRKGGREGGKERSKDRESVQEGGERERLSLDGIFSWQVGINEHLPRNVKTGLGEFFLEKY